LKLASDPVTLAAIMKHLPAWFYESGEGGREGGRERGREGTRNEICFLSYLSSQKTKIV
jgi:hypothetical protein